MTTYQTTCPPLTSSGTPKVCAISALVVDLECASVADLSACDATVQAAAVSDLFLGSGSLGTLAGTGNIAAQRLTVQGAAAVGTLDGGTASCGTAAQPTQTLLAGVGLQPGAFLLTDFVSYTISRQTPHLAAVLALPPVFEPGGVLYLPDAPSYAAPFPPLGYRLTVFNLDQAFNVSVRGSFASIQQLAGAVVAPAVSLAVLPNSGYTFVWTGTLWLASPT